MYRERNGWTDTGAKLNNRCCPKCRSPQFRETLSREYCPSCGLECDYWGGGANSVYEEMMALQYRQEEDDRRRREQEEEEEAERRFNADNDDAW